VRFLVVLLLVFVGMIGLTAYNLSRHKQMNAMHEPTFNLCPKKTEFYDEMAVKKIKIEKDWLRRGLAHQWDVLPMYIVYEAADPCISEKLRKKLIKEAQGLGGWDPKKFRIEEEL